MNRDRFHNYLDQPELLGEADLRDLESVVREYPWFSTSRLLYVKALHNTEHLLYPSQLQQCALHIPDRKALYEIIHRELVSEKVSIPVPEKKAVETKTVSEYIAEKRKELLSEERAEERVLNLAKEAKLHKKSAEEILQQNMRETRIEPLELPGEKQLDDIRKTEEDALTLDTEMKEKAIQSDYQPDQSEKPQVLSEEVKASDLLGLVGHPKKLSFTDWLISIDEGREIPAEVSETPLPKTSIEQIIDKFITEEPRISKPKKEFFNPVNMAKQSVVDDEELVTETLARVYLKQGNAAKALRIYDILRLKYPEKSAYFAALIQEVKNKESNS